MKALVKPLVVTAHLLIQSSLAFARGDQRVQEMELDEHNVYTVPVSAARVTTISFPVPISAIDAALVSTDGKSNGLFQLAHKAGANFFSVRTLVHDARTNLNVRCNNKTYIVELADSIDPVLSLVFKLPVDTPRPVVNRNGVTPSMLVGLLDKAKAFPLLKAHHPEAVEHVETTVYEAGKCLTDYTDFTVHVEEAFRFDPQDTLVFRVTLTNLTDREIQYRRDGFSLRVGDRLYPQSISDAGGTIPPMSAAEAYFAVTGTPSGGRNDISLKNEFSVLVERSSREQMKFPTPGISKQLEGLAK
jgi:hypothetical protein